MNQTQPSHTGLAKKMVTMATMTILGLAAVFFLPAWTLAYWQAWVYMGILFIPMIIILTYFLKVDPEFLARRMKFREKEKAQNVIVRLSWIPMFVAFLLPGFDVRLGWSKVATPVVIGAEVLVFIGYMMIFFVFRENRFASRVVEVSQGQKVIDTGPYALVRHPMYLGTVIMYVFSPIALGSYWAAIPGALIIPVLAARLLNEEKVLARDLPGYTEYMKKTRYHLLPGIW